MTIGETYWRIVASRWRMVLALVAFCTMFAWAFSTYYLATRPTFEAAARLNITPTAEELGYASRFVRGSTFDGGSVLLGTYAEFARTRPVVEPIVDRWMAEQAAAAGQPLPAWIAANSVPSPFSPGRILSILNYGEAPAKPLRDDVIDSLLEGTTIENVEGTYLVRIQVAWEDARSAAWFANALARAIIAKAERTSRNRGQSLSSTLEERLGQKQAALARTLDTSRSLKSRIGVVDIDRQKQSLIEARLLEQALLTTDQANLQAAEGQVAALRRQAAGKLSSAQAVTEQTLAVEAPRAIGLAQSVATRQARIGQIGGQLESLSGYENRVKLLDDQARALTAEVQALTERVSFSETENLANTPRIQVIDWAVPPLTRSSPKIFFNTILGFIAGCALAACLLLLFGPGRTRRTDLSDEDRDTALEPAGGPLPLAPAIALPLPAAPAPTIDPMTVPARPMAMAEVAPEPPVAVAVAQPVAIEPDPEPEMMLDRRFGETLPQPANGEVYSARETTRLAALLVPWLSDLLAPDRRPLFVAAGGPDRDAQHLYRLLYDHLRRAGFKIRTIDATLANAQWAAGDGKPLVYLGGAGQSALTDAFERLPADADLVVAVTEDSPAWRTPGFDPPAPAHVVPFAR